MFFTRRMNNFLYKCTFYAWYFYIRCQTLKHTKHSYCNHEHWNFTNTVTYNNHVLFSIYFITFLSIHISSAYNTHRGSVTASPTRCLRPPLLTVMKTSMIGSDRQFISEEEIDKKMRLLRRFLGRWGE